MDRKDSLTNVMRWLPLTIGLWLGYLLALFLIDHLLYPIPVFTLPIYLINGLGVGIVFVLWRWGQRRVGRFFLPVVIVLLSVVPFAAIHLLINPHPLVLPASSPEAIMLRQMPLLLLALILTAWHYGWRPALLFCGEFALFAFILHGGRTLSRGSPFVPPSLVVVLATISLMVVGYFVSTLIDRLRQQQIELAQINAKLVDHAATLEDLTISRERNRMARELHDTLAHTLSALSVQLETVKAYWEVDPQAAQQMLDRSLLATRSGLQETRRALKSLRASPLEDLGLALAVRHLATETAARANLALTLAVPEQIPPLSPTVEQCIYRVAQEALANAAHHANARALTVQLVVNGEISLRVGDDGLGFDPEQSGTAGHFGLSGMRERAHLAGGALLIDSRPGQGTTIQLTIGESNQ